MTVTPELLFLAADLATERRGASPLAVKIRVALPACNNTRSLPTKERRVDDGGAGGLSVMVMHHPSPGGPVAGETAGGGGMCIWGREGEV